MADVGAFLKGWAVVILIDHNDFQRDGPLKSSAVDISGLHKQLLEQRD